ncbi:MAG TPA: hypothetical protein PLZ79_00375 [Burkholderiales bacterium]|nr:hypothetical protein [Burkholderiales bacterium]
MDLAQAPVVDVASADGAYGNARLVGQFVLSRDRSLQPPAWLSDRVGDWCLGWHPRLPVMRLLADGDRPVGWMLGYPISEAGVLADGGTVLRVTAQAMVSVDAFEEFVYSFGGRFAVILAEGSHRRVYLDPCGSLSAVYCTHQRVIASTSNLIPYDSRTRDRLELALAIGIPYTEGMYPFAMTSRHGVERLLPNHFLDLGEWQAVRHWPREPLAETPDVDKAVAEIAVIVKRQIAAIATAVPSYLPLTAGLDSRMLLACARRVADRLELFTRAIDDRNATVDCDTARRIARRFNLKHLTLPMVEATDRDLEEWMFRIAYSTSEIRGRQCATMYKQLPGGHAVIGGQAGEIARGYYWCEGDTEASVITPERLIDICICPRDDEPLARARAWLDSLPTNNALRILDFFFVEQDMGGWAGILPYAECDPGFPIFPLCHRRVVEHMLTLPLSYRQSGRLARDIIEREWPELLEWPINQPIGATRLVLAARKAIRMGKRAWRSRR